MEDKSTHIPEVSLRDYLDVLQRRKAIVIQTFVVVFVIGALVTFMSKPSYRTSTRILVEGKQQTVLMTGSQGDANIPVPTAPDTGHDVATQLELLAGGELMSKAFQEAGVPPGSATLQVSQVGTTDIIELIVTSSNAEHATRFARSLAPTYIKYFTSTRKVELDEALAFAQLRLKEETDKLQDAEKKLQAIRKESNTISVGSEREARLKEKNAADQELDRLRAAIAGEQTRLATLQADLGRIPEYITTPAAGSSRETDLIKEKLDDLESERARLALKYNVQGNPKFKDLDELIADTKRRLKRAQSQMETSVRIRNLAYDDMQKQVTELKATLASDRSLLIKAQQRVEQAKAALLAYGNGEPVQIQLEAEASRARERSTSFQKYMDYLLLLQKNAHTPVKVVAPAAPATEVSPKNARNLLYPAIIGLVLGFCFAMLQEFLDDRVNSSEDARRLMDAPILGYVPMVEAPEMRLLSQSRKSLTQSGSFSLLESYRVMRSNVQFASVDNPQLSLLITSTTPGEGKSVTAANLAVAMALDGKRVILVDSDLRRPTIHEKFSLSSRPGLTNVLVGQTSLVDALQETELPGLRILAAGPLPPNAAELLNSQAMRQLHVDLKGHADLIIYDSPPMLATADAQVLSASVDGVLYVIQFGEAKKSAIRHSIELLNQAHANMLGVIFNKIDLTTKRDDYYYGYYAYYQYYQTEQIEGEKRRRRSSEEFEALMSETQRSNGNGAAAKLPALPFEVNEPPKSKQPETEDVS